MIIFISQQGSHAHLRKHVHGSFIAVYFSHAAPLEDSNATRLLVPVLHPEMDEWAASWECLQLRSSFDMYFPCDVVSHATKMQPFITLTQSNSFKHLLYNVSLKGNHSLDDLLSWVFRGPRIR